MKYLVKDEYYDLKDEDKVLHSSYRLTHGETPIVAIVNDSLDMMFPGGKHDKWEELFQEDKIGCGSTEVYEFVDGKTVGENLIDSIQEDHEEIKAGGLNED